MNHADGPIVTDEERAREVLAAGRLRVIGLLDGRVTGEVDNPDGGYLVCVWSDGSSCTCPRGLYLRADQHCKHAVALALVTGNWDRAA